MNLTEEQIEKAFDCCEKNGGKHPECKECPCFTLSDCPLECHIEIRRQVLILMNSRKARIEELETQLAINKGAMRAYREAFEKAHDEAVADFSRFLIDKAKDGSIDICDLPDLVAEWRSPSRRDAELMKEINATFDEPSPALRSTSPEGRGKKFFLTCRNPEAEHWILKRFSDLSRR